MNTGDIIVIHKSDITINNNYNGEYSILEINNNQILLNGYFGATSNDGGMFIINKSLGEYNYDYFSYLFNKSSNFDNGNIIRNTKKYSQFNVGDNIIPNSTIFRGLKFNIYDVDNIKISNGVIDNINLKSSNNYEDYKLSIILSSNSWKVISDPSNINIGSLTFSNNKMEWLVIDSWKLDKLYNIDDIVNYNDILYISTTSSYITDPNFNPSNSNSWNSYSTTYSTVFWSPNTNYSLYNISSNIPPIVYNSGEYYYYNDISNNTFWDPNNIYTLGSNVLSNNKYWISSTNSIGVLPGSNKYWINNNTYVSYWSELPYAPTQWSLINLWSPDVAYNTISSAWGSSYSNGNFVIYNDIVYYKLNDINIGSKPGIDTNWKRLYSMTPDTKYQYGVNIYNNDNYYDNNIIHTNNRYYLNKSNLSLSTLENGIDIYINKKYKNILINIYINDNTLKNINNIDRDYLYSDVYSKLSAFNFMNSINDLSNKYDFSDNIKYIIINDNKTINIYDFNNINSITSLPCFINCVGPDELFVRNKSIIINPITLNSSEIKSRRQLDSGNIISIDMINYYNGQYLSTQIEKVKEDMKQIPNYHGLKNNIYNIIYRHSGYYMPIFYNIELFQSPNTINLVGNYKFDTSLSNFGILKERIGNKVNRNKNILKLKNNPNIKSIYPMLDEFGYFFNDFFIFKSSWDSEYYIECSDILQITTTSSNQSLVYNINNTPTII